MKNEFCQLWLTCANKQEADKIANTLLVKQLVACARQVPVKSDYRWQGKIEAAEEIMLVMESRLDLFDEIESEVAELHSYDTFVLTASPLARLSKNAEKWLKQELKNV
ncbi:MAG: divalent-cation tolerance protein CutA [Candidatus Saccharimonadales bacterium]